MDTEAHICAVFPAMTQRYSQLVGNLEHDCRVRIETKETHYPGKDAFDYTLQRDPAASVSDSASNAVLDYISRHKHELDGLLLLPGAFDRRFYNTGLPTLLLDPGPHLLQLGFKDSMALARQYGTNFLTASFNDTDASAAVSEARMQDLKEKVSLFNAIKAIKDTRILDVQVKGFGAEPHEHWWRLSQEDYLLALKDSLGIDLTILDYRDLFKEYDRTDTTEAQEIGDRWMRDQTETKAATNTRNTADVTEQEVLRAARLYVAAASLMEQHGANALTMDATTWAAAAGTEVAKAMGEEYLVSGSLAFMEFPLHGIPVCCQSDVPGLVTQVIGRHVCGRPGLHGDTIIDSFNNVTQIGHCTAPINPYGDDRRVPYTIGGETTRRPQAYVDLPDQGEVTVMKVNVADSKLSLWTGTLVPGDEVYKDFWKSYCCNKIVARTDARRILENYDYRAFGNHNCAFYGDFRRQIKAVAKLLGFEVVEQDR